VPPVSSRSLGSAARRDGALLLLVAAVLFGCGSDDPVDRIRQLQAAGRYAETIEPLRELLVLRGDDPELQYLYGVALSSTGNPSLALFALRKAMESPEWLAPAGLQVASGALLAGNADAADEALSRVLEAEAENARALALRALAKAQSRRDYEGALADAERALEIDPDEIDALVPRAVALLGLGRVDEAGEALEELDERFQDESLGIRGSARYCAARASFAKEKGEREVADRVYGECLEKFPTDFTLIEDAIEFYDTEGRVDRANEILRDALEELPEARQYRMALAARLEMTGRADEAEQILRAATESEDAVRAAAAWGDLGSFLVAQERFDEAVAAFEHALEGSPEPDPQLVFARADALVVAGRHAEALEGAEGMGAPAHRELVRGRVHLERGEPALALERLAEGLRHWPDNPVARYYAARAAEEVGDFDRAIEEYRYSIRSGASATDARLRLARLHAAEGEIDLALAALHHEIDDHPVARRGKVLWRPPERIARIVGAPGVAGRAVAAMAAGARLHEGARAGSDVVRQADRLDLSDPGNAAALRELVVDLADAGEPGEALAAAEASLRARPDAAPFHAIRGLALARGGGATSEAEAAFARALELDADNAEALAGLARLRAAGGDAEAALSLYERAAAANGADRSIAWDRAELLASLGRREQAERTLEALLEEHPYDGLAALRLAELRQARGADAERTRALARRAARFGGGPEAAALLERLAGPA
jgi:tetratricopeptide (TPR) repeat protein